MAELGACLAVAISGTLECEYTVNCQDRVTFEPYIRKRVSQIYLSAAIASSLEALSLTIGVPLNVMLLAILSRIPLLAPFTLARMSYPERPIEGLWLEVGYFLREPAVPLDSTMRLEENARHMYMFVKHCI